MNRTKREHETPLGHGKVIAESRRSAPSDAGRGRLVSKDQEMQELETPRPRGALAGNPPSATSPRPCDPPRQPLDLRGVRCPLNWAKAKVMLETLERGDTLWLLVDDPRAIRDIPRAAEAEGMAVLAIEGDPTDWRILIEK